MALEFNKRAETSIAGGIHPLESAPRPTLEAKSVPLEDEQLFPVSADRAAWPSRIQQYFSQAVERCKSILEGVSTFKQLNAISEKLIGPSEACRFGDYTKGHPDPIALLERVCGSTIDSLVRDMVYSGNREYYDRFPKKLEEVSESVARSMPYQIPNLLEHLARSNPEALIKLEDALRDSALLLRPLYGTPVRQTQTLMRPAVSPEESLTDPLANLRARGNRRLQLTDSINRVNRN